MTRKPRIRRAGLRLFLVVKAIIAENLRPQRISRNYFWHATQHSTRLIKVDRAGHIGWNDAIILSWLGDAIDLDGEQNWNLLLLQLAGKRDHRRGTPTVPVKDDAGLPSLRI